MQRQMMIAAALALVSLGAACTSSERAGLPTTAATTTTTTSSGASGPRASSPDYEIAPSAPAETGIDPPPPASGPLVSSGEAGSAGEATTGGGGSGGAASTSACAMPPVVAPVMVPPVFQPVIGPAVTAAVAPRPVSGGTLVVLRDGHTAVASDPDRDVVYVADLSTRAVRARVALVAGDEPGRLVEDGAGLVHVALRRGGAVVTLDPAMGTVTSRQSVCAAPRGLAYEAAKDLVHVACAEGTLVSLRASGGVTRTVTLRRDLRDVVVIGDGTLLVSTFKTADVLAVDASGTVTSAVRPPARHGISPSNGQPRTMSPAVAWRMVPANGSSALLLHQRGVDDPISVGPGGYAAGKGCDGIVESTASLVFPGVTPSTSSPLAMVTLAVDVAVSPDGTLMALAVAGSSHAPAVPVMTVPLTLVTQGTGGCTSGGLPAGPPSMGAASAPPPPPGQAVSVAFEPNGAVVAQSRDPDVLWTSDGLDPIQLSSESTHDTGHLMFHVDAGGGVACASCHPEGGEDGRTWSFACLGPRRSQSLRGGLSGTEPFHWDGDMPSFPDLVQAVFVGRMSGPQPTADQTAAMLRWLDTIPELPTPPPAAPAAVERGRALFGSATLGCTTCHAGPRLTNNLSVDVGTGLTAQVPSLRGVGWRAPFLHNGCAPTLADRFGSCGGGDRHGHTSQLAPSDVADLTAFLETL
ncbi:MAG TPA: cytochrome c [Polyangia bacterium]|nr:cytochrome c [Polyangia bacterium]